MAAEFYFTVKRDAGKCTATFQADDGEEYVVKYSNRFEKVDPHCSYNNFSNKPSRRGQFFSSASSRAFSHAAFSHAASVNCGISGNRYDTDTPIIVAGSLSVNPSNTTEETMTLEWKKKSEKLITIRFYDNSTNKLKYDKSIFVNNELSLTLLFTDLTLKYVYIKIIPHVVSTEYRPSAANEILTPTKEREPVTKVKLEQLSTDMNNLLLTGNLSDVVLTDGSKIIRAHKLVLSTRSSVFAKMLQHPMKENLENRIAIQDTSIEVLLELLHFMYSGIVTIKDSKMARELYVTADKYDVKDLKIICSVMLKSVNLNNVLDTLLLAELYSDKALKDAALNFISKHYSQLKAQQNWNGFIKEHQSLAIEILSTVIDKKH